MKIFRIKLELFALTRLLFKFSLLLAMMFIFCSPVMASERQTQVYEGDTFSVTDGGSISIYNHQLNFVLDGTETKILVTDSTTDLYATINIEGCRMLSHLRLCFDRVSGSALFIRVFSIIPNLGISQSFEEEEFLLGSDFEYSITISNIGDAVSNETKLSFTVPPELEVVDTFDAEYDSENNEIVWEGSIMPGSERLIRVTLRPLAVFEFLEIRPFLEYSTFYEREEVEMVAEISSYTPLNIKYEPKQGPLGNPFIFNLTLENVNYQSETSQDTGYDIRVRSFNVPINLLEGYSTSTGFIEMPNRLFWSGVIRFNESRSFVMTFQPTTSGTLTIPIEVVFNDTGSGPSGEIKTINYNADIEFFSPKLEVYYDIGPSTMFNASSYHMFNFVLRNYDSGMEFKDIKIILQNDYGISEKTIDHIFASSINNVKDLSFFVPPVASPTRKSLELIVSYLNEFGESRNFTREIEYTANPINDIVFFSNITEISDISYRIETYVSNAGSLIATNLKSTHELPERLFFTGNREATLSSLEPGDTQMISSYEISIIDLNLTSRNYTIGSQISYEVNNLTRIFSEELSLNELIISLHGDESYLSRTRESIERVFTSTTVFAVFVSSIILLIISIVSLTMYKKQFTISGYDSLSRKQKWIENRKKKYDVRETKLRNIKSALDIKIKDLTEFMGKTKKLMERELPVIEEKKDGLRIRQEELLREKKIIDEKIDELKEIEQRLLKRNYQYEKEFKELETREDALNKRFNEVKSRLNSLTSNLQKLLDDENKLSLSKEKLNNKELGVIAEKQKIIKMGSDKFSNEKIDVIQEKVRLEHERNSLEEELFSLKGRKDDISSAQESIQKEKADLKKEKNLFDANKEAVESSLKVLKEQSDKLKNILIESKESAITRDENSNSSKSESNQDSKSEEKSSNESSPNRDSK